MKYLSYGVMYYMLLALIWWTILLSKNNYKLYEQKKALAELRYRHDYQKLTENIKQIDKEFTKNKYMIIGEGLVFGLTIIFGIWMIQRAYQKELKSADQQKNFLLSVTHELKSPIASIHLIAETLLKRKLPETKVTELHTSIISESRRLEKLVNNILMATKLEHDYHYHFLACSMNELVSKSIHRTKLQHPKADISFIAHDSEIIFDGDKEAIDSIITNLLENSIKYSKDIPKVRVNIELNQENVVLKVSDQGIGIPDIEKSLVKKQFYRIGNEETRNSKGTGLGLYIVSKIVAAHHGKFIIQDNVPVGTIVIISLPLHQNQNIS